MPNSQLAMESAHSTTESVSPESEQAWHLFSLLLSLGRPARPDELSSRCTLFRASSGLVEFLCLIPKSPIFLTDHRFVTMSSAGLTALGNFVSNSNLTDLIDVFLPARIGIGKMRNLCGNIMKVYFRKRKQRVSDGEFMPVLKRRAIWDSGDSKDGNEDDRLLLHSPYESQNAFNMAQYHILNAIRRSLNTQRNDMSILEFDSIHSNRAMVMPPLRVNSSAGQVSGELKNIINVGENHVDVFAQRKVHGSVCTSERKHSFGSIKVLPDTLNLTSLEIIMASRPDLEPTLSPRELDDSVVYKEPKTDGINLRSRLIVNTVVCQEEVTESNILQAETWNINDAHDDTTVRICEIERMKPGREEELFIDSGSPKGGIRNLSQPFNTALLDREPTAANAESLATFPETKVFAPGKQLTKPSAKLKTAYTTRKRALFKPLEHSKAISTSKENQHSKRDQISVDVPKKLKQNQNDTHIEEKKGNASFVSLKDQLEPKVLPNFESFIVEEEEGSGGYGIVYRARRKTDGSTVAIKCPHANAHRHHVNNELKMLEQFGGKNFVIKYEGSFENGNCSCFVLEHVEHDRPEVLKKEMDVFQLQWYGYCMFRALASLHKEGVVHRDVKPGNFLFSRKANKGYLIDFNLALDLDQKCGTIDKTKAACDVSINRVTLPHVKSVPPTKSNKFPGNKSLEAVNWEASKNFKPTLEHKNLKKKPGGQTKANNELGKQNIVKSQGADGSGITSAKDLRSTRTPSVERLREPLPCKGRKELISLLQNAMQSPNNEASSIPAPMRKRVSAPAGKLDKRLVYLTPMPLHSPGISFSSASLTKGKGGGKHKREGPCVGTKGFRAPEVLFRSLHQGPKVDIWSAGVTLLYLMIGRTPFVGDPGQNIKDIARLRGSEDLWEVAKLHNRESSFSKELYDIQFLPPMKLRDWCKMNTKRPAFVEDIPRSLFDLVDKCLMVNPRVRISAEEALKHEFFTPCHESLRRQRMRRQGLSLDSGTSYPLDGQSIVRTGKVSS